MQSLETNRALEGPYSVRTLEPYYTTTSQQTVWNYKRNNNWLGIKNMFDVKGGESFKNQFYVDLAMVYVTPKGKEMLEEIYQKTPNMIKQNVSEASPLTECRMIKKNN